MDGTLDDLSEAQLQVYQWVDSIPLSRPKKSITRDFADGVLMAEVFKRMGFTLPREECEAVANCEPGAVERVLELVKAKMARFQEGGGRTGSRAAGGCVGAEGYAYAPAERAAPPGDDEAAGALAALHIGGSGKAGGGSGGTCVVRVAAGGTATEQALHASLADKEEQLAELRETNEVRLKDAKIQALLAKMAEAGAGGAVGNVAAASSSVPA
eukprot:scaffold2.g7000.t1